METDDEEPQGMGEAPRVDPETMRYFNMRLRQEREKMKIERPSISAFQGVDGQSPRWRVIVELLVVAAISGLVMNAIRDARFEANVQDDMTYLKQEVAAIAQQVKPVYRGGDID